MGNRCAQHSNKYVCYVCICVLLKLIIRQTCSLLFGFSLQTVLTKYTTTYPHDLCVRACSLLSNVYVYSSSAEYFQCDYNIFFFSFTWMTYVWNHIVSIEFWKCWLEKYLKKSYHIPNVNSKKIMWFIIFETQSKSFFHYPSLQRQKKWQHDIHFISNVCINLTSFDDDDV